MTHSIQEITVKISALPEPIQQEVFDFIEFMHAKVARQALTSEHESALLSERIRIDCVSVANHNLIRLLDEPWNKQEV